MTEPWVTNWLTPLWLVSVGVLVGLLLLLLLWVVAAALSRIPAVGDLAEDKPRRNRVILVLSIVLFLVLMGFTVIPQFSAWQSAGGQTVIENLAVAALSLGLLSFVGGVGIVWLVSRRTVAEVGEAVREGPLWPLLILAGVMGGFGVVGGAVAYNPTELFASLMRTPFVRPVTVEFDVPATETLSRDADPPQHPVDVHFRISELRSLDFRSTQRLTVDFRKADGPLDVDPMLEVAAEEDYRWNKPEDVEFPIEGNTVTTMYVRNYGPDVARVEVLINQLPEHPQVGTVLVAAVSTLVLFVLYILQRATMPRLSAVALSTMKSEMAQPLFLILLAIGATALVAFVFIPYHTLGDDIKVQKDSSLTLIMVLCIIQAVWAASTSVADEIEGRTALTVLSKPISRRSFIIGKFLGISWTVAVMFIALGVLLLIAVAYKPVFSAREGGASAATWQMCHFEMIGTIPGLALAFMETLVLAALSVAISTRLPMLPNFIICFSIYVLGHLTPLLVQSAVLQDQFAPVVFVAQFIATLVPVLDHFNIQAAVAAGIEVPYPYLGWTLLYCLLYGTIALLLALILFEDRDVA